MTGRDDRNGRPDGQDSQRPGEFDLIRAYFAPLARDPGSLGLTDDATVYHPGEGCELVLTKDMLSANVHFFADDPPEAIASKALRVNLSDLAAKGAVPRAYLLGLGLPDDWTAVWLERFACGLNGDQAAFDVTLVGGDTIRAGDRLQISITAIGELPEGTAVRRSGGSAGDLLYVTGTLGDAAAGLRERLDARAFDHVGLEADELRHILHRYLLPQPRVALAPVVRAHASAAMDVSDGLMADAGHLARASKVDLHIDLDRVPLSPALRRILAAERRLGLACLGGGDDYEILCLVPVDKAAAFEAEAALQRCPVTCIGTASASMDKSQGRVILQQAGVDLTDVSPDGFRHF
ncbi:thiamine-phosphate kinase [Roseibium aestuarii]|uniref:Thiamine-monophosphate kinase n=1 Tax=Roseibium aestuarii TaxID=2600299 RepID=A0ABW4JWJ3_9HYPH|nr:thiamine-phosphate kinase [Roseibium aestuarii]